MRELDGYPNICVRVEVSIDDAAPATFACIEDRCLADLWPGQENYARMMSLRVEEMMPEAIRKAIENAVMVGGA